MLNEVSGPFASGPSAVLTGEGVTELGGLEREPQKFVVPNTAVIPWIILV